MAYKLITHTLSQLHDNPQLLKQYQKEDFSHYFEELIKLGDVVNIDSFLSLPISPKKAVGVHVWNGKNNSFSYYESYLNLSLEHNRTNVFEYFYSQRTFKTNTIIDRMCASNNIEMIDFILTKYPPTNINNRTNLLFSAMNDGFLEQFKLLLLHDKNPVHYSENEALLKKACLESRDDFVTVLMIDCSLVLSSDMKEWLSGENEMGKKFDFPEKLVRLRELHEKLQHKLIQKPTTDSALDKKMKI